MFLSTITMSLMLAAAPFEPMPELRDFVQTSIRPLAPDPHPYTIGKGRFAYEVGLLSFDRDRHNPERAPERVAAWDWPVTLHYGLTANLDLQFGFDAYVTESVRDREAGTRERSSGFGDLSLRAKYNLLGNDGADDEAFAIALRPEIRLPTRRHDLTSRAAEFSVGVPMKLYLPEAFELEITPTIGAVRNVDDDGYALGWENLVVLGREIVEGWTLFAEFESVVVAESGHRWEGVVTGGVTWDINDDLLLEFGASFGVTRSADDYALSLTLVQRF